MPVNVDITQGPVYNAGALFSGEGLGIRVGVIDSRFAPSSSQRYLLVRTPSDLSVFIPGAPGSLPDSNPWNNSLFIMAGQVLYHVYNNVSDIRYEDNLDIIFFNPSTTPFITSLEDTASLFCGFRVITISNIDDVGLASRTLYASSLHDCIALFYGYVHTNLYGKIYLAADAILGIYRLIKKSKNILWFSF